MGEASHDTPCRCSRGRKHCYRHAPTQHSTPNSPTAAVTVNATARCRYSEAIAMHPDKACLPALHSNRSLAYCKAQRYCEALADGDAAAAPHLAG